MNDSSSDNPLLTRYALDELPVAEREAVCEWIESQPDLQAEVTEIQNLAEALRASAPLHDLRLTSSQRHRVLQPPARKPLPAAPRPVAVRPVRSGSWLGSLARIAALVTFALTAFWMGRETRPTAEQVLAEAPPAETPATETAAESSPTHLIKADLPPAPAASEQIAKVEPVVAEPVIETARPETKTQPAPAVAVVKASPQIAFPRIPSFGLTTTRADAPFINASRTAADLLPLHPRQLRQPPLVSAAKLEAKPVDPALAAPKTETPARKKPDLYLHSWSAEVATCPWDPQLRLIRVNLQFPADQEAVQLGDPNYPLEVTFDPNNVRQFRRLGTRHVPSPEVRSAGHQVVWYEFRPNGSPAAAHESGKHIATVRLPAARFTTQAVGPFDATRLQVLDRGQDWRQARDDFRFETAMLGLGLLLDGGLPGSRLDHQLLIEVAESAKGTDPEGSRARLVQALRQLAHLTGR